MCLCLHVGVLHCVLVCLYVCLCVCVSADVCVSASVSVHDCARLRFVFVHLLFLPRLPDPSISIAPGAQIHPGGHPANGWDR